MRWRWVFAVTVWMAVGTGCPETWREGGTIDRAMAKDLAEEMHRHNCPLNEDEWREKCEVSPEEWELNHPLISAKPSGFKDLQTRQTTKSPAITGTCENEGMPQEWEDKGCPHACQFRAGP